MGHSQGGSPVPQIPQNAASATGTVVVATDGDTPVVAVSGTLDGETAITLLDVVRESAEKVPTTLTVDLTGLCGFSEAGLAALCTCRTLASRLPGGLHYRVSGGVGQEALLTAFASDVDEIDLSAVPESA